MSPLFAGAIVFLMLLAFGITMAWRVMAMRALKPENRNDRLGERAKALLVFGFGQKRMVDPEEFSPGLMHLFIFIAFLAVQLRSGMLFVMGFSKGALDVLSNLAHPFWHDKGALLAAYQGYLFVKDIAAGLAVIGVVYFL